MKLVYFNQKWNRAIMESCKIRNWSLALRQFRIHEVTSKVKYGNYGRISTKESKRRTKFDSKILMR